MHAFQKKLNFVKKSAFLKSPHLTQKVGLRGTLRPMYLGNFRMITYSNRDAILDRPRVFLGRLVSTLGQ